MYSKITYVGRFFSSRRKMPQGIKKLMITSIIFSQLALPSLSFATGRVFVDDLESGTTRAWTNSTCPVVRQAPDGGSPHSGSYMMLCNWNGAVPWSDPNNKTYAYLASWSYYSEYFIRFWVRFDRDVDHKSGSKLFRLGFGGPDEILAGCSMEKGDQADLWLGLIGKLMFWGSPQAICGDHNWHKLEMYFKDDINGGTNGTIRVWVDGIKVKEWVNTQTHTPGAHRYPFHVMSNWSSNSGWEHDANNHVLFDDFEIFSDTGTGAVSGSMAEGTIAASGGGTASPLRAPRNLRVIQ